MTGLSVISLTGPGLDLAARIASGLEGAECLGPAGKAAPPCQALAGSLKDSLPDLFRTRQGLVFVGSAGLLIRLLAPLLSDKSEDPAVVVVDLQGRFAVSLLSGHLGGANQLARRVAAVLGGQAVITTATDGLDLPGWDLLAQELGLKVENPGLLPPLTSAWLDGESLALVDPRGLIRPLPPRTSAFSDLYQVPAGISWRIYVGERLVPETDRTLLLRPPILSAGMGCHRGTGLAELEEALTKTMERASLSPLSLARLASIDRRRDTPALARLARKRSLELAWFSPEELAAVPTPNPSGLVARRVATPSVCEAAAILSWPRAELIVEKTRWTKVTVALARVSPG